MCGVRHVAGLEERHALGRREVRELDGSSQWCPGNIRAPLDRRRIAAGEHDDDTGGELREPGVAQPGVERRERLVGVEENDAAIRNDPAAGAGCRCCVVHRPAQRLTRRRNASPVERDRRAFTLFSEPCEFTQQSCLADAAGTVHVEDEEGRIARGERRREQRPFGVPGDEARFSGRCQSNRRSARVDQAVSCSDGRATTLSQRGPRPHAFSIAGRRSGPQECHIVCAFACPWQRRHSSSSACSSRSRHRVRRRSMPYRHASIRTWRNPGSS